MSIMNAMNGKSFVIGLALSCAIIFGSGHAYAQEMPTGGPNATQLGSMPWMAARVAPSAPVARCTSPKPIPARSGAVDPRTGDRTQFASGLPQQIAGVGLGGAMDVAFIGGTAYACGNPCQRRCGWQRHRRHLPNGRPR